MRLNNKLFVLLSLNLIASFSIAQVVIFSQDFSSLAHSSNTYLDTNMYNIRLGTIASHNSWTFGHLEQVEGVRFDTIRPNSSASIINGGMHNYNGKVGSLHSGGNTNAIGLNINTIGYDSIIKVSCSICDVRNIWDGTGNTKINELTLQYRSGTAGNFITLDSTNKYTTGNSYQIAGTNCINTPTVINFQLPAATLNQPIVQLRWVQKEVSGAGSRPSIAIDDIIITGFSKALPVTWLSFTGLIKNGLIELKWSTASEWNNSHFEIQRSNNNTTWELIAKVQGAGNSNSIKQYHFSTIPQPLLGYYRLKQVDFNGQFDYSRSIYIGEIGIIEEYYWYLDINGKIILKTSVAQNSIPPAGFYFRYTVNANNEVIKIDKVMVVGD